MSDLEQLHEIEQLVEHYKQELERVKAQVAEMRTEMEWATREMRGRCPEHWSHALSSDAGKDYFPKSDMKPLLEALQEITTARWWETANAIAKRAINHAKAKGWL